MRANPLRRCGAAFAAAQRSQRAVELLGGAPHKLLRAPGYKYQRCLTACCCKEANSQQSSVGSNLRELAGVPANMAPGKTRKEGTRTAQRGGGAAAMSTKGGKDGRRQKPAAGGDERFAAMHSDPRFRRFPKAGGKVEIDSRFAGMFSDEAFAVAGGVDKRGRKVGKSKSREDMRRYYRLAGEEEEEALAARGGSRVKTGKAKGEKEGKKEGKEGEKEAKTGRVKKSGKRMEAGSREEEEDREEEVEEVAGTSSSSEEDEEEGVDGMDARAKELYLRARGLAGPDSSGSSSSDDSEGGGGEESENEDEDEEELDIGDDPDSEEDPEVQLEKMKEHFGIGAVAALEANEQDITLASATCRSLSRHLSPAGCAHASHDQSHPLRLLPLLPPHHP